jgi:hypothetical protein
MRSRLLLPLLILAAVPSASAQMEREGASKTTCEAILAKPLTPAPKLDPAFKSDCDSTSFYFGIGRDKDYTAARQCAFVERDHPRPSMGDMFYGPGILSMIYANGQGTRRDITLARRFTCEEGWAAPAELDDRLALLNQIASSAKPPHFDLCATATSGLSMGTCASIDSRLNEARRLETLHIFADMLPPEVLPSFHALQTAEATFDDLRSSNEVDLSGTGRAAFELMEQDKLRDQFLINLKRIDAPTYDSPVPLPTADRELNAAYQRLRQTLPATEKQAYDASNIAGTVSFDGVQKTQRAWLTLRDAWVAYAAALHSTATPDQVAAVITMQRVHQLKSLAP